MDSKKVIGLFNWGKDTGFIKTNIPDGIYINKITNKEIKVTDSKIELSFDPVIIWV